MHRNMSVDDMRYHFIFIVKGSYVIDGSMIDDWRQASSLDRRAFERMYAFSKNETTDCVGDTKFKAWFNGRSRRQTFLTIEDAITFMADWERYQNSDLEGFEHVPNFITDADVDNMIESEIRRLCKLMKIPPWEIKVASGASPPWWAPKEKGVQLTERLRAAWKMYEQFSAPLWEPPPA